MSLVGVRLSGLLRFLDDSLSIPLFLILSSREAILIVGCLSSSTRGMCRALEVVLWVWLPEESSKPPSESELERSKWNSVISRS